MYSQAPPDLEGGFQGDGDGRRSANLDAPMDPFSTANLKEWTPAVDAELVHLAKRYALDWKKIAEHFPGHTEKLLERRYILMTSKP